jgi:transposase
MYLVEHEAERRGILGTAEHLALRRVYTRPIFVRLLLLARGLRRAHGPKTLLGRAARYTWNNQLELSRALRDARIPLDNNRAENALRVIAVDVSLCASSSSTRNLEREVISRNSRRASGALATAA